MFVYKKNKSVWKQITKIKKKFWNDNFVNAPLKLRLTVFIIFF